jgi:hypothetical protein
MSGHIVQSFKAASTLSAYRAVALNGTANTVAYPTSNQVLPIGVTLDTVKDTTQGIPVAVSGSRVKLYFNDTVASGALVASDSSGRGVPFTLANTTTALTLASAYLGVLVGAAVAATGTIADVLVCPGFDRE